MLLALRLDSENRFMLLLIQLLQICLTAQIRTWINQICISLARISVIHEQFKSWIQVRTLFFDRSSIVLQVILHDCLACQLLFAKVLQTSFDVAPDVLDDQVDLFVGNLAINGIKNGEMISEHNLLECLSLVQGQLDLLYGLAEVDIYVLLLAYLELLDRLGTRGCRWLLSLRGGLC